MYKYFTLHLSKIASTARGFIYLFANLEVVVAVVDEGGEVVAEAKAVQPEVEDGGVDHLKLL